MTNIRTKKHARRTWLLGTAAICASTFATATAQAQAPSAPTEEEASGVTEIIVTAQKRAERLQDVPVAISAFSADKIEDAGITDLSQIGKATPGLYVGGFSGTKPQIYLRGIGSRQFDTGSEPSVGVFVDDVYVGRFSGIFQGLSDIERVEVLKGPQGTLYGRNTIGGTINIVTQAPTNELTGNVEASYGNFDALEFKGSVAGPIVNDKLSARLSFYRARRDGYIRNIATGNGGLGRDESTVRLKLRFTPSDNATFDLIGLYSRDQSPGQLGKNEGALVPVVGGTPLLAFPDSVLAIPGLTLAQAPSVFFRSPGAIPPALSTLRYADAYDFDPTIDRTTKQISGKLDLEGDSVQFVSVTAYRTSNLEDNAETDNTSLRVVLLETLERSKQFSQEFRLLSTQDGPLSFGGKLDWILGLYYFNERATRTDNLLLGLDSLPGAALGRNTNNTTGLQTKTDSIAAFGQATLHVTDAFNVTAGLRWSRDKKRAIYLGQTDAPGLPPIVANFGGNLERSWESVDPRITLDYKINRDAMLYATYSKGFKSGGFQWLATDPFIASQIFNPEKVDAFEIGFKTQWLDRALTLNGSLFSYDYKNLQVLRLVPTPGGSASSLISNAASSRVKGGEIEIVLVPTDGLDINFGYNYLDAKYKNYSFNGIPGQPAQDFSGTPLVRAPKHTLNAAIQYAIPVGEEQTLTMRGDWSYTSSFWHEPGRGLANPLTAPLTREPGYSVFNFRATYETGPWRISAFVNNAFDKYYRQSVITNPPIILPNAAVGIPGPGNFFANPGQVIGYPAPPRMYGVTIGFKFN